MHAMLIHAPSEVTVGASARDDNIRRGLGNADDILCKQAFDSCILKSSACTFFGSRVMLSVPGAAAGGVFSSLVGRSQ